MRGRGGPRESGQRNRGAPRGRGRNLQFFPQTNQVQVPQHTEQVPPLEPELSNQPLPNVRGSNFQTFP